MGKQNTASSQPLQKFVTGIQAWSQDEKPLLDEDYDYDYDDDWMEVEQVTPTNHFPTMMETAPGSALESRRPTAQVQWLEMPQGPLKNTETSTTAIPKENEDQGKEKQKTHSFDRANLLKKANGVRKLDLEVLERRHVQRRASISDMRPPEETCDLEEPPDQLYPPTTTTAADSRHRRHFERHDRIQHGHGRYRRRASLGFEPELGKENLLHTRSKTSSHGENETSIPHVYRTRLGDSNSNNSSGRHSAPSAMMKETLSEKKKARKFHSSHHHKRSATKESSKNEETLLISKSSRRGLRSSIGFSLELGLDTETKDVQPKSPGVGQCIQGTNPHRGCATNPPANRPVRSRTKHGRGARGSCVGATNRISLDAFLAAQQEHSANNL